MKYRDTVEGHRIVILCEGDTEEIAIRHFVRRQWHADGLATIGLQPVNLGGKLEDVYDYARRYVRQANVSAVFTLIDLYGMNRVQHRIEDELRQKADRVKAWLRQSLASDVLGRFYPHVSVHEIEAWILAEGHCLARRLKDGSIQPDTSAELRNFAYPPSRRLDDIFKTHRRGDGYRKINDGTPLFKCLQFELVYTSCRYFREFYDDLKTVGQSVLGAP